MTEITVKTYAAPPLSMPEALRYAGVRGEADEGTKALLLECVEEARTALSYRVCFVELDKSRFCALLPSAEKSKGLREALTGSARVLLFAATVGVGLDRLISRYASLSPARALLLQGLGAERIESLCDLFSKEWEREHDCFLGRRFSPGYGDLPLALQTDIFKLLDCPRKIGLTLTDSLMMSPTKSVTAIVGIKNLPSDCELGCATCAKKDCELRK